MTTATATKTVELEKFLGFATAIIRVLGYVSGKDARERGELSTGEMAWEWAIGNRPEKMRNAEMVLEDRAGGRVVAKWMAELPMIGANEYMSVLARIGTTKLVTEREIGYAASAIEAMAREKKRERESDPKNPANQEKFLGKVGEKISLSAKYISRSQFDSRFGLCYKYSFEDGQGRKISWLTSTEMRVIEQGNVYTLVGTVKKHSTFKGNCETEITRAKVGG